MLCCITNIKCAVMSKRFFQVVLVFAFVLGGCSSSQELNTGSVRPVAGGAPDGHGLYYYLPRTVIEVELVAEKRVEKAGPFYRFAQRFLNITEVITADKEEWVLTGASVQTRGEADPSRLFRVSTTGAPALAALNLASDGVLRGLQLPEPRQPRSRFGSRMEQPEPFQGDLNFNDAPLDEEQLIKSSTTAMAEEVAREIYRLRDLRKDIVAGEADVAAPEVVLAELDKLEAAYLALFVGKRETRTVRRSFSFLPEGDKSLSSVLVRFSAQKGFVAAMDVSGTPVYLEVEVHEDPSQNFVAAEAEKNENRRGLVYSNPARAQVRVVDRTVELYSGEHKLGQYGQVLRLPADLFDQQGVGVELDPATGALRRVFFK